MDAKPRDVSNTEFERIIELAHDDYTEAVDQCENRQERFIVAHAVRDDETADELAMAIIQDEGYSVEATGEEIHIDSESFEGYTSFRTSRSGDWLLPREATLNHKYSDAWVDVSAEVFEIELVDELQRIENSEPRDAAAKDAWARSRGI